MLLCEPRRSRFYADEAETLIDTAKGATGGVVGATILLRDSEGDLPIAARCADAQMAGEAEARVRGAHAVGSGCPELGGGCWRA